MYQGSLWQVFLSNLTRREHLLGRGFREGNCLVIRIEGFNLWIMFWCFEGALGCLQMAYL